jgi:hypothetical protein
LAWTAAATSSAAVRSRVSRLKFAEKLIIYGTFLVGRDRIELSTHGFSVHCSTD